MMDYAKAAGWTEMQRAVESRYGLASNGLWIVSDTGRRVLRTILPRCVVRWLAVNSLGLDLARLAEAFGEDEQDFRAQVEICQRRMDHLPEFKHEMLSLDGTLKARMEMERSFAV